MDAEERPTDTAGMVEILEGLRPQLRRLLAHYGIPRVDWDDLLQDAFVAMLIKGEEIRDYRRWLIGTIRYLSFGYRRRPSQRRVSQVDPEMLDDLAPPRPPLQERRELLLDITALAALLPARQRRLLTLRFGLGMTNAEVARSIGCSTSHARKLTLSTLEQVKREAGRDGRAVSRSGPRQPPAGNRSRRGRPPSASRVSPSPSPR